MGDLADRLARFFWATSYIPGSPLSVEEHLSYPHGHSHRLRGSDLGREVWEGAEAGALLDLIVADVEFLEAFAVTWQPRDEARRTLAGVAASWRASHVRPEVYARSIEEQLWKSLRRREITVGGLAVVEGFTVPEQGIALSTGLLISPPTEPFLAWAFGKAWPEYTYRLPEQGYCLFHAGVSADRRYFGGVSPPMLAYIYASHARDAVWLATGEEPHISHAVVWDDDPFPITPPLYVPMDFRRQADQPERLTDLAPYDGGLAAIVPRLKGLSGQGPDLSSIDPPTLALLRRVREQASDALASQSAEHVLLLAFATAENTLVTREEAYQTREGFAGQVPSRFSLLCASSTDEQRQLKKAMEALQPVRRAIAHGEAPDRGALADLVGRVDPTLLEEALREPGVLRDRTRTLARRSATNLLSRLYRSWLLATLEVVDGQVTAGLAAPEVQTMILAAGRGDQEARARLQSINAPR